MTDTSELEARLREKEELVAALTERLEQAAEQLDRLRRTGADRGNRAAGGIPADLVERQQQVAEELHRAVQQWEEMQAAETLSRIEDQICEVRDLIRVEVVDRCLSHPPGEGRATVAGSSEAERTAMQPPGASEPGQATPWEALKAQFLNSDAPAEAGAHQQGSAEEANGSAVPSSAPVETIDPVDPPAPVNLDSATPDELRQAVEARDEYVAYLIKKLRMADARARLPENWSELQNLPDELRQRVQELHDQLEEKLRLAEVEQSLERARLAREAARIKQLEEEAQERLQRLRKTELSQGEADRADEGQPAGNRWLRMLGIGRNPGDEEGGQEGDQES